MKQFKKEAHHLPQTSKKCENLIELDQSVGLASPNDMESVDIDFERILEDLQTCVKITSTSPQITSPLISPLTSPLTSPIESVCPSVPKLVTFTHSWIIDDFLHCHLLT